MTTTQELQSLARTLDQLGVRRDAGPLVVGYSGGPDSTYLAWALEQLDWPRWLVHVDHRLGPHCPDEAAYVRAAAARHGWPLIQRALPVGAVGGASLEAVARRLRYRALAEVAVERGAAHVATAHTTDDQAETLLLRLDRGTGLRGLAGIRPRRPLTDAVTLVRPLLDRRRSGLREALARADVEAFDDPTNRDPRFARNRLRHGVLGRMAALLPRIAALAPAAGRAGERCRIAAREALAAARVDPPPALLLGQTPAAVYGAGAVLLDPARLREAGPLQYWVLRAALGERVGLERRHLAALADLLAGPVGRCVSLPGVVASLERHWLALGATAARPLPPFAPVALQAPGGADTLRVDVPGLPLVVELCWAVEGAGRLRAHPGDRFTLRPRRPGDRLARPGGRRDLRRLQQQLGLPAALRPAQPLLTSGDRVLWLPGLGVDTTPVPAAGEVGLRVRLRRR